jgi:hypothetical protein
MLLSWQNETQRSSQTHDRFGRNSGVSSAFARAPASDRKRKSADGRNRSAILNVRDGLRGSPASLSADGLQQLIQ